MKLDEKVEAVILEVREHEESKAVVNGKTWRRGEPLSGVEEKLARDITKMDPSAWTWRV
jgi:hypothetical protein